MASASPQWPVRADHRFLLNIANMVLSGKIHPRAGEFDRLSRVFSKAGGSWQRIFNGSSDDVGLLKQVLKAAFKHGYLTKKEQWK